VAALWTNHAIALWMRGYLHYVALAQKIKRMEMKMAMEMSFILMFVSQSFAGPTRSTPVLHYCFVLNIS